MDRRELTYAMHSVLDGEATDQQKLALEQALATDPAAREEFQALRRLFERFEREQAPYPPEGLVASVLSQARLRPARGVRQLFQNLRVSRLKSHHAHSEEDAMNEPKPRSTKQRNVWIGTGLTALAVAVAGVYLWDNTSSDTVSGTITPAQRYRAPQLTPADVKLGEKSGVPATATPTSSPTTPRPPSTGP